MTRTNPRLISIMSLWYMGLAPAEIEQLMKLPAEKASEIISWELNNHSMYWQRFFTGYEDGLNMMLCELARDQEMTVEDAAAELGKTVEEFESMARGYGIKLKRKGKNK